MNADPWALRREIAAKLEAEYPMWRVWITETLWWATRRTPLPPGAMKAELYATVAADTAEELRDGLEEQATVGPLQPIEAADRVLRRRRAT